MCENTELSMSMHERNGIVQPQRYPPAVFDKVLIVGLGQLGLPVAKYVKEKGFDTYGYDSSTKAMDRAEKTEGIKKLLTLVNLIYTYYVSQHTKPRIYSLLK